MVRAAEREQLLDELQRRVRLRAAKGGLGATDRKLLGDEAARLGLSEDELLGLTRPIPNLVEAAQHQWRCRARSRPARRRARPIDPPPDPGRT